MYNPYQETLAERSIIIEPSGDGEYWRFWWFMDPIVNGLSKGYSFCAHVSCDGQISMLGMGVAISEEEGIAQREAMQFAKERYNRFGIEKE